VRASATVREGLGCFIDYLPIVHSSEGVLEVRSGRQHGEMRWVADGEYASNRQGNYQSAVLQMMILRMLAGKEFRPSYVTLVAGVPAQCRDELEQQLGCRVEGGSLLARRARLGQRLQQALTGDFGGNAGLLLRSASSSCACCGLHAQTGGAHFRPAFESGCTIGIRAQAVRGGGEQHQGGEQGCGRARAAAAEM